MRKIMIMSDSPRIYTGFSHIGRKIAMRLHETGDWEVSYLGWFDDGLNEEQKNLPFTVYRTGRDKNNKPVRDDSYAYRSFKPICERVEPEIVLSIGDCWMIRAAVDFGFSDKETRPFYSICYPPIDGNPIPKVTSHIAPNNGVNNGSIDINWVDTFAAYDECIAYCKYGMDEINRSAGREVCNRYIHFGVDTDVYKKLPYDERVRIKKDVFGLEEDDFLIVTVARNQPRKLYPTMLEAVSRFINMNERNRRVFYYIHTPLKDPAGWNLVDYASNYGLRCRNINSRGYLDARVIVDTSLGVGKGPSDEILNLYYNAADVGLFIYSSEGWGMPPHECMSSGTATIMTRYSAPTDWAEGKTCWVEPFNVFPESRSNFMRAQVRPVDVQDAIVKVYKDKEYRHKIAREGHKFAQSTDWARTILPKWEEVLSAAPTKSAGPSRDVLYLSDADDISIKSAHTQPMVSIIIPTFNGGKMLVNCINSIRSSGYENYEIIIADNSTWERDSKHYIKELKESGVKVIEWNSKYSPSKVLNLCAKEANGDYLLFLDNDTVMTKGAIEGMIKSFVEDPNCGASSCKLVDPKTGAYSYGVLYDGCFGYITSQYGRQGDKDSVIMDALTNSCMMVRKSDFFDMGMFDERYKMYYEDFDYSYRVNMSGKNCRCRIKEHVMHYGSFTNRYVSKSVFVGDHMKMIKKYWGEYIPRDYRPTVEKKKERVGIIKLLTMGDVILTTPLHPVIRERHKDAHITMYTSQEYHDLFVGNPYIDELKVVGPLKKEMFGNNWGMLAYDAVTFNIMNTESNDVLYQMNQLDMNFEYRRTGVSMTQGYADMFGFGKLESEKYLVYLDDENRKKALGLDTDFAGIGPLVVMHTTAGWTAKEWEPGKFAELAEILYSKYRARIYVVGGPNEKLESPYVRNVCGKLSLRDIIALQERADLFIGCDSGPMHLAKAANCPMIVLFGCTNPYVVGFDTVSNFVALQSQYAAVINCGFGKCPKQEVANKEGKECSPCTARIPVRLVEEQCDRMLNRTENIREFRKGQSLCSISYSNWEWRTTMITPPDDVPDGMCNYGYDL
jgi:ADP-heptose:LPS heptosyltransferase/GT2 family glycosyltransferase/glycosyltransferase involved in cell wall biosynthesis